MVNHNRLYSIILAVLGIYLAVPLVGMSILLSLPERPSTAELGVHLPDWSIPWIAMLHAVYVIGIIVTLFARHFRPECGRWLSRILNWSLLLALPVGPILGFYGLWKLDKEFQPSIS